MSADKPFFRYFLLFALVSVIVAGTLSLFERNHSGLLKSMNGGSDGQARFSPAEDLEASDIAMLNSARSTIDVAMYAFTDQRIEAALTSAAKRGVKIRIYRDGLQLADEETRASRSQKQSTTDLMKGITGIEIRAKGRGASMHLKSYCVDGSVLRTGSANWSPEGEIDQDNDFYLVHDQKVVRQFEDDFAVMWDRSSNITP